MPKRGIHVVVYDEIIGQVNYTFVDLIDKYRFILPEKN